MKEAFKTSNHTNPNLLAGAIAGAFRECDCLEIQAIGAGAVNQALKAVAIARGFLAPTGHDLTCTPAFAQADINGQAKTSIKIIVYITNDELLKQGMRGF